MTAPVAIVDPDPGWPAEFRQVEDDYADVKDPAVDLIHLAAQDWAARVAWVPAGRSRGRIDPGTACFLSTNHAAAACPAKAP